MGYLQATTHDPPEVEVTDSGAIIHIGGHAIGIETGSTDGDTRIETYGQVLTILGALGKSSRRAQVKIAAELTMIGSECEDCDGTGGAEITTGPLAGEWLDCEPCHGSGRIPDFDFPFAQVPA